MQPDDPSMSEATYKMHSNSIVVSHDMKKRYSALSIRDGPGSPNSQDENLCYLMQDHIVQQSPMEEEEEVMEI